MSEFDDRKKVFEKKFEIDAEALFKVTSRAARGVGAWAASKLELAGAEAEAYVHKALEAVVSSSNQEGLIAKIERDFQAKKLSAKLTRAHIVRELEEQIRLAREAVFGKD